MNRLPLRLNWQDDIPEDEWRVYSEVITSANDRALPFFVGGALCVAAYTGVWRNTKDLDLFIPHDRRDDFVDLISAIGFTDLFEQQQYERHWIYRGVRDGMIVDLIWNAPNGVLEVKREWLVDSPELTIRGQQIHILPPEELVRAKLYVVQRKRCDWTDLLNVLHAVGPVMNWDHLLTELADDARLLAGLLSVFAWICSTTASELPPRVWRELGLPKPERGPSCDGIHARAGLLDSRPWFALGEGSTLEAPG